MKGVAHVATGERIEGLGIYVIVGLDSLSHLLDLVLEPQAPEEVECLAKRARIVPVQRSRDRRRSQARPCGSRADPGREARVAGDTDDRLQAAALDVELPPVLAGAWSTTPPGEM